VTSRDLLVFDERGPVDNPLRFADECVRHKTLDLVGDLALAGCDLIGHVVAHCSGHRLNAELVAALSAASAARADWKKTACLTAISNDKTHGGVWAMTAIISDRPSSIPAPNWTTMWKSGPSAWSGPDVTIGRGTRC
jgi:hypothetical protein